MEKEQKKLLLVAVSVGVFLLVTITVAIVILTPRVNTQEGAYYTSSSIQPARIQSTETPEIIPFQPLNNNQEINSIADQGSSVIAADRNNGDSVTIQIQRPSTAAVPDTAAASVSAQTRSTAATATTPAATRPAAATQTATTSRTSSSTSTATARPASPARTINDYWVQTGAFSAMIRAEDAKEKLAYNGLTSIIENREIDGRIWYRVRLGPYTTEREANYWLALVKSIDGFGESQVRQTVRQQ